MGFQLYTEIINYNNDPLDELLKFTKLTIAEVKQKMPIYKLLMNKQLAQSIDCNEIKKNLLYDKSL